VGKLALKFACAFWTADERVRGWGPIRGRYELILPDGRAVMMVHRRGGAHPPLKLEG